MINLEIAERELKNTVPPKREAASAQNLLLSRLNDKQAVLHNWADIQRVLRLSMSEARI